MLCIPESAGESGTSVLVGYLVILRFAEGSSHSSLVILYCHLLMLHCGSSVANLLLSANECCIIRGHVL